MKWILALLALVSADVCLGQVQAVSFEVSKIYNKRDPYIPEYSLLQDRPVIFEEEGINSEEEHWTHRINLGVDYNIYRSGPLRLYWDQDIAGYSTRKQYRKMYWDWELGASFHKRLDIFWHHRSEHGLETADDKRYPLEDIMGIRVYLYRR